MRGALPLFKECRVTLLDGLTAAHRFIYVFIKWLELIQYFFYWALVKKLLSLFNLVHVNCPKTSRIKVVDTRLLNQNCAGFFIAASLNSAHFYLNFNFNKD